ncbi:MAG: hypothetical protein ACRD2C_18965 [Acidimicrobiales bacterium]
MSQQHQPLARPRPPSPRQIGTLATAARVVGGTAMLAAALLSGIKLLDILVGIVAANAIVLVTLAARGASAPPLRLTGPFSHVVNIALVIAFLNLLPVPAMLFYGSASLLAAARGYGACEMFAVANWLRHRDDQFGCPFYLPFDLIDQHLTHNTRSC